MISITSSRIKKALLHPQGAFLYLKNYLKGEIIRQKCKHPAFLRVDLKRLLGKKIYSNPQKYFLSRKQPYFFTEDHYFLEEIANQDFIIPTANRISRQEFGFLGLIPKTIKIIDWNEDIRSGYHWPYAFYLDLREHLPQDYNKGRDIKMVWELSRFHYLVPLALAYYKTGEKLYLEKWQSLILDWIKKNPIYYGPNWLNAMEVAIRACNWIFSFEIIKQKIQDTRYSDSDEVGIDDSQQSRDQIEDVFLEKFITSLIEHGRFIYNNLEYAPLPSNHYLSDLTGLFFLGVMFPEIKEAKKWLAYSQKSLEREIKRQVYQDGVDYELSISYHRYVLELFLWVDWLAKLNGISFSDNFERILRKMIEFSWSYLKPNGLAPQIGDSDDSRLFLVWDDFYNWEKRDHSSLFKLYEKAKGEKWNELEKTCRAFPQSGYYIMRDSPAQVLQNKIWTGNGFYLITGRNKCCFGKGGSHVHNDILSFELAMEGEDIIIDPGTFVYSADKEMRNLFRSTNFHNTVVIDGKEQNRLSSDIFFIYQDAQLTVNQWKKSKEKIIWEGKHNGYARLRYSVIHKRRFEFQRKPRVLFLIDSFRGKGKHTLQWNFHLAPSIKVWVKEHSEKTRDIILMGKSHSFLFSAPKTLNCAIMKEVVSPSYGNKIPAKTIRFSGFLGGGSPNEFHFRLEPLQ